ncbi:MAG TPA: Rrf2 family transcriptional regulator [Bacteroidetes bacterium]|nr:Rrf2 family transcriptional regulator [Bacteroidota bacterium]
MFSKTCKYGIRAVLFLAVNTDKNKKIGVIEIAERLEVPRHFLGKVLQVLKKEGLISSIKGPGGGFYLSKENRKANIEDIVECLDGPSLLNACVLGLPNCSDENPCPLHFQAYACRHGLQYQLRHQSIDELARKIRREEIRI